MRSGLASGVCPRRVSCRPQDPDVRFCAPVAAGAKARSAPTGGHPGRRVRRCGAWMGSLRRPGRSGKGSSLAAGRPGPAGDGRGGLIQRAAPCLSCLALPTAPGCYTGTAAADGGAERWLAAGVVLNKSNRPPILHRTPRIALPGALGFTRRPATQPPRSSASSSSSASAAKVANTCSAVGTGSSAAVTAAARPWRTFAGWVAVWICLSRRIETWV